MHNLVPTHLPYDGMDLNFFTVIMKESCGFNRTITMPPAAISWRKANENFGAQNISKILMLLLVTDLLFSSKNIRMNYAKICMFYLKHKEAAEKTSR